MDDISAMVATVRALVHEHVWLVIACLGSFLTGVLIFLYRESKGSLNLSSPRISNIQPPDLNQENQTEKNSVDAVGIRDARIEKGQQQQQGDAPYVGSHYLPKPPARPNPPTSPGDTTK